VSSFSIEDKFHYQAETVLFTGTSSKENKQVKIRNLALNGMYTIFNSEKDKNKLVHLNT
jgi:hypothetical protein